MAVRLISLTAKQLAALRKELARVPIGVLARRHSCSALELCASMRAAGEPLEAHPVELQYILNESKRAPLPSLRDELQMTVSQFAQLCSRLDLVSRRPSADLTLHDVVARTQWLVGTKLAWEIDDELPRRITSQHFVLGGLNACVTFATKAKEQDRRFRGFPAVAFLVCTAYPGAFQPFQFRHAKANRYFAGRDGRRQYLDAVRWMLEEKLELKRESLKDVSQSKYFLRAAELQFYGLGAQMYRRFFRSKKDLVNALLKSWDSNGASRSVSTDTLRATLVAAGRSPGACEVPGCGAAETVGVDIHHIVPRAARGRSAGVALHRADNLLALCPNHHRAARDFPWESSAVKPSDRRAALLDFLAPKDGYRTLHADV